MSTTIQDVRGFTLSYFMEKRPDFDFTKRIRDIRIDSLDMVEFLMALEEKFDLEIEADLIDQDATFEQFCKLIETRG